MTAQIIALHGPAGSGKTFCATMFIEQGFARVKFADPLKRMFAVLLEEAGVPHYSTGQYIEGDKKEIPTAKLSFASPRDIMQGLGEWGREIDADFWVNLAMERVNEHLSYGRSVVIDDCRYPNEAQAVLDLGGQVVQIEGRRHTVLAPHAAVKASEKPLPRHLITDTLNNTGDWTLAWGEVSRIIAKGNKP